MYVVSDQGRLSDEDRDDRLTKAATSQDSSRRDTIVAARGVAMNESNVMPQENPRLDNERREMNPNESMKNSSGDADPATTTNPASTVAQVPAIASRETQQPLYSIGTWDPDASGYTRQIGCRAFNLTIHELRSTMRELQDCGYPCHRFLLPNGERESDGHVLIERTDGMNPADILNSWER
jgi:hypothetical protein